MADIFLMMDHVVPIDCCTDVFNELQILKMGRQICIALEDSNRRGLLHGQITPRCIFRDEKGDYCLGGYTGAYFGDLGDFRAPELAEKKFIDGRADVYSLGMVLYWLLNDRQLPDGNPKAPKHGSENLKSVVMKAIARNPEARYQTPEEMRKALTTSKKKIKPALIISAAAALAILLLGMTLLTKEEEHVHAWQAATCTTARICKECGETAGSALGHTWTAATCTAARTCKDCGETEGTPVAHAWLAATCTTARVCKDCGETDGAALGHTWVDATCTTARVCKECSATEGAALGHSWQDATRFAPKTCGRCEETEGKSLGYSLTECRVLSDSNEPGSTSDVRVGLWTDKFGGLYADALRFWVADMGDYAEKEYIQYQLDGEFAELVLTMAAEQNSGAGTRGKFYVYSENGLLYESEWITTSSMPITKTIDIRGCKQLMIQCVTDSANHYFGIVQPILYN